MPRSLPRIGVIGAGKVGSTLARALAAVDYPVVAVASRTLAGAATLAARLPGAVACEDAQAVVDAADVVFITTPDAAICGVASALRWRNGVAAVHCSGIETRAALRAAAAQGAATASLHPLQTFADVEQALLSLPGSYFGLEADGPQGPTSAATLRETLLALVADLGGHAIELRAEDKALYHAGAVIASNYAVTLMRLAADAWSAFGVDRGVAVAALLPLLRGAASNLEAVGLPAALTGPIVRGDVETLRRHVEALATRAPALLPVYAALGRETLPLAVERGLPRDVESALRALLTTPTPSSPEGTSVNR